MQSLRENPFRLLGLLSSSSSKEIDSRCEMLRLCLETDVEPNITPDYYCPEFGCEPMSRLPEVIKQAQERLALDQDKLLYALLWFVQMNETTDSLALEALAQGDLAEAESIWRQQVYTEDMELRAITNQNCSAFHNLSVCLLCSASEMLILSGVQLGLMALEQGSVLSLLREKLGVQGLSLQDVELLYLNRLSDDIQEISLMGKIMLIQDLTMRYEYTAKEAWMASFALKASKRSKEQAEEKELGAENPPKQNMNQSKKVTENELAGRENPEHKLGETPSHKEQVEQLAEVTKLEEELAKAIGAYPTIEWVTSFVSACEPLLAKLKAKQGNNGLDYQKYSTKVAKKALQVLIIIINGSERVTLYWDFMSSREKEEEFKQIQKTVGGAWGLMLRLEALGLEKSFRDGEFKENKEQLEEICKTCRVVTTSNSRAGTTSNSRVATTSNKSKGTIWESPVLWGIILGLLSIVVQCSN